MFFNMFRFIAQFLKIQICFMHNFNKVIPTFLYDSVFQKIILEIFYDLSIMKTI